MLNRLDIITQLSELNIPHKICEHSAIFTVSDSANLPQHVKEALTGSVETKNLFLRDEKRATFILVCVRADTRVRLKELGRQLGLKGITFASSEDLQELLKITPGSVCLFTVANDTNRRVRAYIDASITEGDDIQNHPLDNTATVVLSMAGMIKFCRYHNHELTPLEIPQ